MNAITLAQLREISIFATMNDEALTAIVPLIKSVQFAPGQTIIHEGDAADCCYVLLSGRVKFTTQHQQGQEIMLGEAGSGETFGEIGMLTGERRSARVTATEPTYALMLGYTALKEFLLTHPQATIDIMRLLAVRLHQTGILLREAGVSNANQIDDARRTIGDRISDWVAQVMGSWSFIFALAGIIVFWIVYNSVADAHNVAHPDDLWATFDDFPFILLNLGMSLIAVFSAPIIMMSQNRAAKKDRLIAEIDHQVNVKSESQISLIVKRLDDLEKSQAYRREADKNAAQ